MKKILITIIIFSTILYAKDYREYYENGQLKVSGKLKDGVGEGTWFSYYENGQIQNEMNYKNGEGNGLWRGYYETGEIKVEVYCKDDKFYGDMVGYYKNGQPSERTKYKEGLSNGKSTLYFKDGNIKSQGYYKDGVKYGRWVDYFDSGQPWVEVQYIDTTGYVRIINSWDKNGNITLEDGSGIYIDYYDNGVKYSQGTFLYGKPNGEWLYFGEEQEIIKKEFYEDGELVEKH
tara:strand:+ start:21 stop:716 length:696 start_codon:yes stop_codon:yes gene_type:complete